MLSLTIIIPTFNRKRTLKKVLQGYLEQQNPQCIGEILVIDDGSTDDTRTLVEGVAEEAPFKVRYVRQEKKGPAAARNLGIRETRGELILFTDDDVIPSPNLAAEHLAWHAKRPDPATAVLGYVTWPEVPPPTPFMRWYGECGALFGYRMLQHGGPANFRFFYTCNLSLKTEFLRANGQFDEDFKIAAYEDIELGYRLENAGMRLLYNSSAVGYHDQFFSFADACRKADARKPAERILADKALGKYFEDQLRNRESGLICRLAKLAALSLKPAIAPGKALLDSQFEFPSIVYQLFWYYATRND